MHIRDLVKRSHASWGLRACEHVGADPWLRGHPTIYAAPGRILIGDHFRLSSRPVASHLAAGPDGAIDIGNDVSIGHGAAIAAYERITIGDGTCIGPFVIIMDTNFHGASGDQSVQHDCRPVTIGKGCRIGSRVTITRGASIGDGAEILAGSVVSSAIPPDACAAGARARVIGRAGHARCRWDAAAVTLPELIARGLSLDAAPRLEDDPSTLPRWNDEQVRRLTGDIACQYGVALEAAFVGGVASLAALAEAIERARPGRTGDTADA